MIAHGSLALLINVFFDDAGLDLERGVDTDLSFGFRGRFSVYDFFKAHFCISSNLENTRHAGPILPKDKRI